MNEENWNKDLYYISICVIFLPLNQIININPTGFEYCFFFSFLFRVAARVQRVKKNYNFIL